ncbi:acetolactate synthase large subunit, partial [Methylobacterium sp. WL93]
MAASASAPPVGFFAYPGKPSVLSAPDAEADRAAAELEPAVGRGRMGLPEEVAAGG